MSHFESSVDIAKPQATVFAFVDDASKAPQWLGMCASLEVVSPGPKAVGTKLRYSYRQGRNIRSMDGSVTGCDRPRRLEMTFSDGCFETVVSYELESIAGGTRFRQGLGISALSFFGKLTMPIVRIAVPRQAAKDSARLKAVLEAG